MMLESWPDIFCGVINGWNQLNSSIPVGTPIKRAVKVVDSGTGDCFLNFLLTPFNRTDSNQYMTRGIKNRKMVRMNFMDKHNVKRFKRLGEDL